MFICSTLMKDFQKTFVQGWQTQGFRPQSLIGRSNAARERRDETETCFKK